MTTTSTDVLAGHTPLPGTEDWEPAPRLRAGMLADAVAMSRRDGLAPGVLDLAMRHGAGHPAGPFAVIGDLPAARRELLAGAGDVATTDGDATPDDGDAWAGPVGVLGTGLMASGIVEVIARSGRAVTVLGRSADSLDGLRARIRKSTDRAVAKGRLDPDGAAAIHDRIRTTVDDTDLAGAEVVVEAVAEELAVKQALVARLDAALPAAVPLATNTSSYRVADVCAPVVSGRPTLALHFFNPAPAMKLLEIALPAGADRALAGTAAAWGRDLGKVVVEAADRRGFIVNRLLIPYLNDAARAVAAGADPAAVDTLMTAEAGHPMGPLALIDLIGLDVTAAALASMAEAEADPRLVPAGPLTDLIGRGRLGRKSGAGFHEYA
ncbi:3-hydroxyacyl-CoA dehydrogenase family protein [Actinomycetospora flava]|uniref:3-hydroxyacyl-CoA dehydrogenase NAD-binding domain-containing protein n=1 Tax=Actinomycetospora flava TaxID=3129232 RepID=A0ABU8MAG4_9PSEU